MIPAPRRTIAAIAALLLAATTLAATAGAASATSSDPSDPHSRISFMVFGDPAELAAYQGLVAAFEEEHPDIDVDLSHVPSQADYRVRLGADFAAGTPADVVLIGYGRYAPFAARGLLEPLGRRLRASDVIAESDFYAEALDPYRWQGELMCIPQNVSSLVVYYDKDLFDAAGLAYPEAGWTWDDFLASAQALTRDTDGDGVTDQYGLGTEVSLMRLAPFVWQNGGEVVVLGDGRRPVRLALDARPAREAIQWFVDLQVRHHVVPGAVEEGAQDSESRFLDGRTAMFLNSRRGVPTYREITGFDWDVAPLPGHEEAATVLHSDAYCMPSAARDKDAAWTFIEFANSEAGQSAIAATGRTVPSLVAVADSPAFLDPDAKPANSQAYLDVIPLIRPLPVTPVWVDVEEVVGEELERAFYGNASVDDAIAAMIARTTPYFAGEES